jgi:hypothetical protein
VSLRSSYTQKEKEPDSTHSGIAKKALYIQKFYYLRLDSLKWSVSFICFVYFTRGPVVLRWDRYGFPFFFFLILRPERNGMEIGGMDISPLEFLGS